MILTRNAAFIRFLTPSLGLVALNGLLNDKLDFNETQLGNHAKELTEFGFLA